MTNFLRVGSTGSVVTRLQTALNTALTPSPRLTVNGQYDGRTEQAVRAFQAQAWLEVDGYAGLCTQNALFAQESFPAVLHNVAYIRQPTATTCWAASAAMLKGTSVQAITQATPARLLNQAGALINGSEAGASGDEQRDFGRIHGLTQHPPRCWLTSAVVGMVARGPVMMQCLWNPQTYAAGTGSDGHWVVLIGVRGTRNETGRETTFRIYDPLNGIYSANYAAMLRRVPLATYALFTR